MMADDFSNIHTTKSFEGNRYLVFRLTSLVYKFSALFCQNLGTILSTCPGTHSAVQFFHRLSRNKTHSSVFPTQLFFFTNNFSFFLLFTVTPRTLRILGYGHLFKKGSSQVIYYKQLTKLANLHRPVKSVYLSTTFGPS